ncbi:jg26016 [Pararge aegeria aegeria]|uniref:Jg26016 protein n=1 Tax=Pararge aegeria aegeria TaxID=348720 RepID=A0A8S4RWS7_9NEOP|nr:jg26016 [Pararge aegeria aegeria]
MECKLHNTGQGVVSRSASFTKLRESLRRSSVRLFHRLAGRHSAHLPPDVDYTQYNDPDSSMKRASSLSELSKRPASPAPPGDQR